MVEKWHPEKYKDDYRRDLMKMIEDRVEAGQLEASPEPAPKPERAERGQVVDLMALLKRSLDEGGKKPAKKAARKPARKADRKPAHRPGARRTGSGAKRKSA
jgi:DNA end-binding protein Ku